MLEYLSTRCNAIFIKNKLKMVILGDNSYITPITLKMCRNLKYIYSKVYIVVSPIARG